MSDENLEKQIEYLKASADRNWETSAYLLEGKKYTDCLLFAHLTIEKILKALITKNTEDFAPYIHDLVKLSKVAGLNLSEKQVSDLREITSFNMLARYDDEKDAFYRKADHIAR